MRNRTITLVAFAAFAACGGGITVPSAHAGEGWCRLDDPGTTEQIRRERKLANDKLDQIACPTKLDVTKLPDELWLPMPCNHFIGLRKIQIGVKNLLDQNEIYLGDAEAG